MFFSEVNVENDNRKKQEKRKRNGEREEEGSDKGSKKKRRESVGEELDFNGDSSLTIRPSVNLSDISPSPSLLLSPSSLSSQALSFLPIISSPSTSFSSPSLSSPISSSLPHTPLIMRDPLSHKIAVTSAALSEKGNIDLRCVLEQ